MQKYLISILIWSSEPLCYINVCVFFKRQRLDLYFPKFRNDIQSTKGNIFASVAGTVTVGI